MKILTKELNSDLELHEIHCALETTDNRTLPLVFFNGHDGVADSDIYEIDTGLNLSDRERKFSFMILPATFTFLTEISDDEEYKTIYRPEKDFLSEYVNRLRIITYLPEEILSRVKDKRLLAMGYAEYKVKRDIINYVKEKKARALNILQQSYEDSIKSAEGLTIEEQFGENNYIYSVADLYEKGDITSVTKDGKNICMVLNGQEKIVLSDVEILEEEINPENTYIELFELHNLKQWHELHLLVRTVDENQMMYYHYVTYRFKDMYFHDSYMKQNFKFL